jgi:hypothetical protein
MKYNFDQKLQFFANLLTSFCQLFDNFLKLHFSLTNFYYFDCASQLWQQILCNKFHISCAYFTPNCTWSPNYSVLVSLPSFSAAAAAPPPPPPPQAHVCLWRLRPMQPIFISTRQNSTRRKTRRKKRWMGCQTRLQVT